MHTLIENETEQTLLHCNAVWQQLPDPAVLSIPEISSGFVKAPWIQTAFPLAKTADSLADIKEDAHRATGLDPHERQWPTWFRAPLEDSGNYEVQLDYEVTQPGRVTLFANHRQLVFTYVADITCIAHFTFHIHIGRIIPRGMTEPMAHRSIDLCLFGPALMKSVQIKPADVPTVFIMGDSTVTDQSAETPWSPLTSYSGWGQMLPAWANGAAISNHAHSGLTTESFKSEGHWDIMQSEVRAGDLVLMQFGHNDQKLPHLKAMEGYADRLRAYIDELRGLGSIPVLVTPLARNTWLSDGQYNDLLAAYGDAVVAVGQEKKAPVIDLHQYSMDCIKSVGMDAARIMFYPGDYTHTNDHGAYQMAAYIAEHLADLGLQQHVGWRKLESWQPDPNADRSLPPASLLPDARFAWNAATTNLPASIERPDDPLTRAAAFEMVVQACRFFGVNVYNDAFDDVTGHETWAGIIEAAQQNGLIPPAMIDGKLLHPLQSITPCEFADVLIRGALARLPIWQGKNVPDTIPAFARRAVGLLLAKDLWNDQLTQSKTITRSTALTWCNALMR